MANKELATLSDKEENFIDALIENGGSIRGASIAAGYGEAYGYQLRKRLAKHIAEAAQEYLAIHAVKAGHKLIGLMDAEMPNPTHLNATIAVLDRAGVIKKDFHEEERPTIKANIFILPEKRFNEVIDTTFNEIISNE